MSHRKLIITSITTILACGIIMGVFGLSGWFGRGEAGFSSALLPEWKYRRLITLSGQTSDLTAYQVKVELPASLTSSLVSAGKLQSVASNFADIRFTDANDNQLLNFWIETATTTATSTIWVKVPGLSANKSSMIYMYYGNPGATSASDGTATFEFFDDFEGDLSAWTAYLEYGSGTFTSAIENGMLSRYDAGGTIEQYMTNYPLVDDYVVEAEYTMQSGATTDGGSIQLRWTDVNNVIQAGRGGGYDWYIGTIVGGSWVNLDFLLGDPVAGIKSTIAVSVQGTTAKLWINGDYKTTVTIDSTLSSGKAGIREGSGGAWITHNHWDNYRIRKYASPEPTAQVGEEQTQMTPVAHWRFDEGSGTTTYDGTDNNNDGIITGASWTTGKYGNALSFDGNDFLSVVDDPKLDQPDALSFSVWVKRDNSTPTATEYILYRSGSYYIARTTDNKIGAGIYFGGTWNSATTTESGSLSADWTHIEVTYDKDAGGRDELKIYIDGILKATGDYSTAISDSSAILYIGAGDSSGNNGFQGRMDDLRFYGYARTPEEVALDYNAGLAVKLGGSPGSTEPAIHHWRFEEGSGSTVADSRKASPTFQDYDYVRPITVTNSTSSLFDYQIPVDLTSAQSLIDGLVGSWHMNEGTGTTTADMSGNSNNGTAFNMSTSTMWVTGVEGGALSFDGVDDYVEATVSQTKTSYSLWIKPSGSAWEHVVKIDSTYYVNGVLGTPTSFPIYVSGNTVQIGKTGASAYFNGTIDEVRIYDRALSTEEIKKSLCIGARRLHNAGTWTKEKYQSAHCGGLSSAASYDWRDLRFSDINNTNLSYWLESDKKAWVKVPTLFGNSQSTIYLYYGNDGATSTSDGTATFEFFDDFDDGVISGWTISGGTWVEAGGVLKQTEIGQVSSSIWTSNFSGTDYFYESKIRWTNSDSPNNAEQVVPLVRASAPNSYGAQYNRWVGTTNNFCHVKGPPKPSTIIGTLVTPPYGTMTQNVWYEFKWQIAGTALKTKTWATGSSEPSLWTLENTDSDVASGGVGISTWRASIEADNTRVRKYTSPEPTAQVGTTKPNEPVGQLNLNLSSSAMWTEYGRFGRALKFNGTTNYALTASQIIGTGTFSYSLWFKRAEAGPLSTEMYLFNQGTDDPSVYIDTDNKLKVKADGTQLATSDIARDTQWHHAELTADGSKIKLYLDGILSGSASYTGSSTDATLYLGSASSTAGFFNGLIDDFRLYNYARDADDVLVDYNAGLAVKLGGSPAEIMPPTHQWRLNKGVGSTGGDGAKPATGWRPDYKYYYPVTITNSGSQTLSNYQVSVTLDTQALISGGEMRSDCGDIRFGDSSGRDFSHWLESGCNTTSTKAWVKVPTLPGNSQSTIYLYYGNDDATSASDGTATFEFFDDFEDGDTSDWTLMSGSGTLTASVTQKYQGSYSAYRSGGDGRVGKNLSSATQSLYADLYWYPSTRSCWLEFYPSADTPNYYAGIRDSFDDSWIWGYAWNGVGGTGPASGSGSWKHVEVKILYNGSTQDAWYRVDGGSWYGSYNTGKSSTGKITIGVTNWGAGKGYFDRMIVRKYASPEPTVSVGSVTPNQPVGLINLTLNAGSGGINTTAEQMWANGIFGKTIEFDGTDDYLSAGNIGNVQTLSFWLAPFAFDKKILELNSSDYIQIDSQGRIDLEGTGWSSPKLYINGREIKLDSNLTATASLNTQEWYHIEVINGSSVSASATNFGKVGADYFVGLMDEIATYDYARTPEQVLVDYNAGLGIYFK